MIIKTLSVVENIQRVSVTVLFDRQEWVLIVEAINGVVRGNYERLYTSQLKYHNYSVKTRERNFKAIKKSVESLLASKKQVNPRRVKQ